MLVWAGAKTVLFSLTRNYIYRKFNANLGVYESFLRDEKQDRFILYASWRTRLFEIARYADLAYFSARIYTEIKLSLRRTYFI